MIKICEICEETFETNSQTRKYCSNCHKEIHSKFGYKFLNEKQLIFMLKK